MKYNELTLQKNKQPIRAGRGISAGRGKTAGRGTKGQGARKSGGVRPGFEGGQMPLYMRLPKLRGFKSSRPKIEVIYTGQLAVFKKTTITVEELAKAKLISSPYADVKLLLNGEELTVKKDVRLPAASQGAVAAIEKAGGSFKITERQGRVKKSPESKE
ncbi:50S ribosomal protein L15 [Candidatus Saccharibacteria bacterium]|nr:50S ribosomal protein L15 [Candidatus Saccharibacteria bacterium]